MREVGYRRPCGCSRRAGCVAPIELADSAAPAFDALCRPVQRHDEEFHAIIDGDWTFATEDSNDFRPKRGSTRQAPCYVGQPAHAGFARFNLPSVSAMADHVRHFQRALDHIRSANDLANKIIEIGPHAEDMGTLAVQMRDFSD